MSWLKTLALLILDAAKWTRPMRNRNRWTRFVLASMVVLAVVPALLVDSGRAADTDRTFKTASNVSSANVSRVANVNMANEYLSTTRSGSPTVTVRESGAMREVAS